MIKLLYAIAITLFIGNNAFAQECGPFCPVCSGSTDGSLLAPMSILISSMQIPGGEEVTGVYNMRFGIIQRFDAGVGYTVNNNKFI